MTQHGAYVEEAYLAAFKRVRNRVRKFHGLDIIREAIGRLHAQRPDDIESLKSQPPWFIMLLIKWTIMYGNFVRGDTRVLSSIEFNGLINLMHDVDGSLRLPSQYESPLMFFRAMAYQQLWHQHRPSKPGIARQALLFGGLDQSNRFNAGFAQQTGITINEWIDLSFMLLVGLVSEKRHAVTEAFFPPVERVYPRQVVARFLRSVSRAPTELREYLCALEEERKRDSSEFRERSPLLRFPLIKLEASYYYYSIPVLFHSLENFVYDTLRGQNAQGFMEAFGPIYERYVQRGMECLGEPFVTESEIRRRVGASKAVDFAVLGERENVLIDAKGVEMTHRGMTSHRPEVITGQAKASVLKGIRQGIETAHGLSSEDPSKWARERNFLLLITFKDLYLGTGADFSSYVVQDRLTSALGAPVDKSLIPLEHMYFVSIDEFDYLVEALRGSSTRLGAFLRDVSVADQVGETKCLQVSQHLIRHFGALTAPAYIDDAFNTLFDRGKRALGL